MILRQFLPARSSEDILAGRVRVSLGGQDYILPVRTIRENRAWKELMRIELDRLLAGFSTLTSPADILARIGGMTDSQMALVRAYDTEDVLPDLEDATEPDLLRATFAILAAAYPLAATLIDQVLDQPELLSLVMAELRTGSSAPTSSSPTTTAGRRRGSKAS